VVPQIDRQTGSEQTGRQTERRSEEIMVLKVLNQRINGWTYIGGVEQVDFPSRKEFKVKPDPEVRAGLDEEEEVPSDIPCEVFVVDDGLELHMQGDRVEVMFPVKDPNGEKCRCVELHLCKDGAVVHVCFRDVAYLLNDNGKTLDTLA
jgi:hypothetical protein